MSGTSEDVHRPSRDIPSMVKECQIKFANLAAAQGYSRPPWIRSAQGDFNLWSTGIRASSYDKSSLTYRLRLDRWYDMREDICDLLKGICDTLTRFQQLKDASAVDNNSISTDIDSIDHTEDESPSSPDSWEVMSRESGSASSDSASIDSNSSLSECISNIHVMLDQLMRITLIIRKSGNRTRFEDIDSGCDEGEYLDFRQLLTTIILRAHSGLTGLEDTQHMYAFDMMKHSSDQSRLNLVQLRLVRANMLRRHRFNIFKAKRPELFAEEKDAPITNRIDAQENAHTPDLSDSNLEAASSTYRSAKSHLDQEESVISRASGLAQTATEPGSSLNIDHIVNPGAKSAATKMTRIGSSQEYPRVPQFESGTARLCPYCYEQLPRKVTESDDESMWKAHLVRDIIPYTCIVKSCSIPDEMYLTAESLLAHMIDKHSIPRWSCDYCALGSPTSDNPEYHQFQVFETATDWIVHFAQRHNKENLAMTDIATLAELNRRQMFKALACPLCHELKIDTEAMDYKIDDHILSHLHEFSLLSLPETYWDTEKTTRSTSQASGLLSHITPIDRYPTLSPRVAEVNPSLSQLQTTMKQAWPLVRSDQSQQIPDLIEQDHQSNTAQVELLTSHTNRLKKTLEAIINIRQDCLDCELNQSDCLHADINMLTGGHKEVENMIEEVNIVKSHTLYASAVRSNLSLDTKTRRGAVPSYVHETFSNHTVDKIRRMLLSRPTHNDEDKANSQSRLALVGPRHSGVFLLAISVVDRMLDTADYHVFWVNAETQESIEQAYGRILKRTSQQLGIQSVAELIHYLSWQTETDWIMVFDKIKHDTALYLVLQRRLPQSLRGRLVFVVEEQSCLGILQPLESYCVPESEWLSASDMDILRGDPLFDVDWLIDDLGGLDDIFHQPLASSLIDAFTASNFHDPPRDYLPQTCLAQLVTKESIESELRKIEDSPNWENRKKYNYRYREPLVHWIHKKAPNTFAIAVQCEPDPYYLLLAMALFKAHQFHDEHLPLPDPQQAPPPTNIFHRKVWTGQKIRDFYNKQWSFLVPVFSPDQYSYDLLHNCIFPFTKEDVTRKIGTFASVHKVRVHPDHQRGYSMQHVAIKEINISRGDDKHGTDEAWEREAGTLANINKLKHPHITECVAAIRRGDSRYFMFPWADGDSLRDYWVQTPRQSSGPSGRLIQEAIRQLRGLADALHSLHYCDSVHTVDGFSNGAQSERSSVPEMRLHDEHDEETDFMDQSNTKSIRHGDLKPENILRFVDRQTMLGTLKLADMGLAKQHIVVTQDRTHLASTRYGTVQYEAPEAFGELNGPRSRLYDVWSMGCITLEFIIWLLYGNNELINFYSQLKGDAQNHCQYFELPPPGELGRPEVHRVVRKWIEAMEETDPECSANTAIADLLRLVQEKLLVVPLPPNRESSTSTGRRFAQPGIGETFTRYRATAAQFRDSLDDILRKIQGQPEYLFTGKLRSSVRLPVRKTTMLAPAAAANRHESRVFPQIAPTQGPMLSGIMGRPLRTADYRLPPLESWEFYVDEKVPAALSARGVADEFSPKPKSFSTKLCDRCMKLDFWEGGFAFDDSMSALEDRSNSCDFCKMLSEVSVKSDGSRRRRVGFERKQSVLEIVGEPFPVLSIFRSLDSHPPTAIQLGFPEPPQPGTETSFEIMRLWLENCNTTDSLNVKHQDCHFKPESVPTRLIDVGSLQSPVLRLVETRQERILSETYIALSHPWGDTEKYPPFCTSLANIERHKVCIPHEELPATFRDAVECTRKLGVRYLWIDSLAIIQGDGGDFNEEAKRMENVFSDAYCVLAASRATSQRDGFLRPRKRRDYVTFQRGNEKPFYVCKTIDNFNQDVIEGSLNKRGWVLQERALARRTIYFTENQTYFECGDGIRCETMTKMHNYMADFLGDPRFPTKAMRATRAEKIAYFQGLYKQYSRLNFTQYDDRPFAIAGLEKRLQKAFGTRGDYGIFDDGDKHDGGLFHRSLLWQRGEEEGDPSSLTPIEFPPARNVKVPSWSWMAYKGGIDFIDPPFNSANWEFDELQPPWTRGRPYSTIQSAPPDREVAITATVRNFDVAGRQQFEVKIVYDTERRTGSDGQRAQCVTVAKGKEGRTDKDKRYYVLLVTPIHGLTSRDLKVYERVGVGFMLGKFISLDGEGIKAKIV